MRTLTDLPGPRNYKLASEPDGRPLFVTTETVIFNGESYPRAVYERDEVRTVIEATTGWCVSTTPQAIVRGRCILLVRALGRRYAEWPYERWAKLETEKVADCYGRSRPEGGPDPGEVLGMGWTSASGRLLKPYAFDGGVLHPAGATLLFCPRPGTVGVVEYRSTDRLLADLLAEAWDVPAFTPIPREETRR